MQNSTVIITKKNFGKKKAKEKLYKVFDTTSIHFYDMTNFTEQELKPMPANGVDIVALIEKYDIKNFDLNTESVAEKINTVSKSDFGERYLLIDATESDPGIATDSWLFHNEKELLDLGIKAVKKTCNFHRTAIVSRYDDLQIKNVSIRKIDFGYTRPTDAELIKQAFGFDLEEGSVEENGVLMLNIQTVISIGLAASGVAPTMRFLTLANYETGSVTVARAPFGFFSAELLNRVYGKPEGLKAYAGSGALKAYPIELKPEIDYTTDVIAYARPLQFEDPGKCTDCGECKNVCPLKLPVDYVVKTRKLASLNKELKTRDARKYKDINISEVANACILCCACTYCCKEGLDPMAILLGTKEGAALEKFSQMQR